MENNKVCNETAQGVLTAQVSRYTILSGITGSFFVLSFKKFLGQQKGRRVMGVHLLTFINVAVFLHCGVVCREVSHRNLV